MEFLRTVSTILRCEHTGASNARDPLLLPLANNGGPTQAHAFRDGSPAFGNGANPSNFTNDQRGSWYVRTSNGITDIGAFQQQVRDVVFASGFD
ncbi:MAG: choice-of-anchor Q domain-containing protein [Rudaea sp.]